MGEKVIVDLARRRGGAKKGFQDLMVTRTEYPYQRLEVWIGREVGEATDPVLDVWLGFTSLGKDQRINRTLRLSVGEEAAVAGLIHAAWPFLTWFTEWIFAEDKDIAEFEQIFNTDQGSQFASPRSVEAIQAVGAGCPWMVVVAGASAAVIAITPETDTHFPERVIRRTCR